MHANIDKHFSDKKEGKQSFQRDLEHWLFVYNNNKAKYVQLRNYWRSNTIGYENKQLFVFNEVQSDSCLNNLEKQPISQVTVAIKRNQNEMLISFLLE